MKRVSVVFLSAALAGCAGVQHSMTYSDVPSVAFSDPSLPHDFRVFDRPTEGRMLINQSISSAVFSGAGHGLAFGMVDTDTPVLFFRRGAELYLESTGRDCVVGRVDHVLQGTNYEAFYTCTGLTSGDQLPTAPSEIALSEQ